MFDHGGSGHTDESMSDSGGDSGVGFGTGVATGAAGVDLREGLAAVADGVAVLTSVDLAELPGDGLGEVVVDVTARIRQLEAVRAQVAARFASSGAWASDGARSAEAWVSSRVNEHHRTVRRLADLGRSLAAFPVMGAALTDGVVGVEHMRVLAQVHRTYPRLRDVLLDAEERIVGLAVHADPARFHRELTQLCHRLDPAAVDADDHDRQSDYHLHASTTLHGAVRVDGLLPPEIGVLFLNALEAARRAVKADQHPNHDQPSGEVWDQQSPGEPDIYQALSHRNVHALHRILAAAISAHDDAGSYILPQVNGARPVISVTVPLDSLLQDPQHHAMGVLERFGVPHAAITSASAQRLACDGVISPLIINRDGQIIATLPTVRAVPAHIRKAVISRDVHCRFPHCRQRIDEVHHIIFASHGGDTTMPNLAGLCYYHHRLIHHGQWNIEGNANLGLHITNHHKNKHWVSHPPPRIVPLM